VVNAALKLEPESRNSMLLKSTILKSLGRLEEAAALQDEAMFQPEGNWTERIPVR
jgi:hypothetical protein